MTLSVARMFGDERLVIRGDFEEIQALTWYFLGTTEKIHKIIVVVTATLAHSLS
jgi:hypothetical protein